VKLVQSYYCSFAVVVIPHQGPDPCQLMRKACGGYNQHLSLFAINRNFAVSSPTARLHYAAKVCVLGARWAPHATMVTAARGTTAAMHSGCVMYAWPTSLSPVTAQAFSKCDGCQDWQWCPAQ
jgi:hypothetical protein